MKHPGNNQNGFSAKYASPRLRLDRTIIRIYLCNIQNAPGEKTMWPCRVNACFVDICLNKGAENLLPLLYYCAVSQHIAWHAMKMYSVVWHVSVALRNCTVCFGMCLPRIEKVLRMLTAAVPGKRLSCRYLLE